jgi:putative transposase
MKLSPQDEQHLRRAIELSSRAPFDEVFRAGGVRVIHTPIRAPWANAVAERWLRGVCTECLDWTLVLGRRHLERILRTYMEHYNRRLRRTRRTPRDQVPIHNS